MAEDAASKNSPALHAAHPVLRSFTRWSTLHWVHAVVPDALAYHPPGHATHALRFEVTPQQPSSGSTHSNWPAAHAVHVDFSAFVIEPAPHSTHVPDDADRVPALEWKSDGQLLH